MDDQHWSGLTNSLKEGRLEKKVNTFNLSQKGPSSRAESSSGIAVAVMGVSLHDGELCFWPGVAQSASASIDLSGRSSAHKIAGLT